MVHRPGRIPHGQGRWNGKENSETNVIFKILSEVFLKTKKHARTIRKILAAFLHEHWVSLYPHWNYEGGHQLPEMCSLNLAAGQCKWPLPVNVSAHLFQTVIIVQSDSGNSAYFGPPSSNRVIRLHCYKTIDSQEPNFKIVSDTARFKMAPPSHLEHVENGVDPATGFARTEAFSRFGEARPEDDIATCEKAQTNMALSSDEHVEPDHAAAGRELHGADEAGIVALVTRAGPDQLSACQHAPLSDLSVGQDGPSAALGYGMEEVEDWGVEDEDDEALDGEIKDDETQDGDIEDDEAQDENIEDYADQQDEDRDDEALDEAARSDIKKEILSECEIKSESAKSENQCFGKSEGQKGENCESREGETEKFSKPLLWEDLDSEEESSDEESGEESSDDEVWSQVFVEGKASECVERIRSFVMNKTKGLGAYDLPDEYQVEALRRAHVYGDNFKKVGCRCGSGYLMGSWYTFPNIDLKKSSEIFNHFLLRIMILEHKKREYTDLWHWLHMLPLVLWDLKIGDLHANNWNRDSRKQWKKLYGKHRKIIHQKSKYLQAEKFVQDPDAFAWAVLYW